MIPLAACGFASGGDPAITPPPIRNHWPTLLPGDVLLSRSKSWPSRLIRAFSLWQTNDARVSHAALALGDLTRAPQVIESLWRVSRTPLHHYLPLPGDPQPELVIWRHRWLANGDRKEICLTALTVAEAAYGACKLPLFALDALFGTYWFTRTLGFTHFKVCSQLVAWAYEQSVPGLGAKQFFGTEWRSATPDSIDDHCRTHPDDWLQVLSTIDPPPLPLGGKRPGVRECA